MASQREAVFFSAPLLIRVYSMWALALLLKKSK